MIVEMLIFISFKITCVLYWLINCFYIHIQFPPPLSFHFFFSSFDSPVPWICSLGFQWQAQLLWNVFTSAAETNQMAVLTPQQFFHHRSLFLFHSPDLFSCYSLFTWHWHSFSLFFISIFHQTFVVIPPPHPPFFYSLHLILFFSNWEEKLFHSLLCLLEVKIEPYGIISSFRILD